MYDALLEDHERGASMLSKVTGKEKETFLLKFNKGMRNTTFKNLAKLIVTKFQGNGYMVKSDRATNTSGGIKIRKTLLEKCQKIFKADGLSQVDGLKKIVEEFASVKGEYGPCCANFIKELDQVTAKSSTAPAPPSTISASSATAPVSVHGNLWLVLLVMNSFTLYYAARSLFCLPVGNANQICILFAAATAVRSVSYRLLLLLARR